MSTSVAQRVPTDGKTRVEEDDDEELIAELNQLVGAIMLNSPDTLPTKLKRLRHIIQTATSSMTAVPKPLKYLAQHFERLKTALDRIKDVTMRQKFADILSVLCMNNATPDITKSQLECLRYCMMGTMKNVGSWGHEYLRHLEMEIIEQLVRCPRTEAKIECLLHEIVKFDCSHHAEIQACDLAMEIDRLDLLNDHIGVDTFERVSRYLMASSRYVDDIEILKIVKFAGDLYMRYGKYGDAFIIAMQRNDRQMANDIFNKCTDGLLLKQLAFLAARQLFPLEIGENVAEHDEIVGIANNAMLSSNFLHFARELDVMEAKSPDDVYKTWLEPTPTHRLSVLVDNQLDSARHNLASSIVNGFVNAGFGTDKLLSASSSAPGGSNQWIYRNREHGMLCATAALGLIHLWDVDGGLTPIDKYIYSKEETIKGGALLAIGLVNCRVRNECDPALALLAEYMDDTNRTLHTCAMLGLGLAYVGTAREDVLKLLLPEIEAAMDAEILASASLASGLISMGNVQMETVTAIIDKLVNWKDRDTISDGHILLALLGLGFCYMGRRDVVEPSIQALQVLSEPLNRVAHMILQMCAYAGTGDVCLVHELLRECAMRPPESETVEDEKNVNRKEENTNLSSDRKKGAHFEWQQGFVQATAVIGMSVVSLGEELGAEMMSRLLGNVGRYSEPIVHRAVPLAIALSSISKANLQLIDILIKYSHDSDEKVSCNAIFALGILGAGTNNARLAASLRQLAVYHSRNSPELFTIRLAQGLVHMGKGTITLSPIHSDRQLIDHCAIAGILIPLISMLDSSVSILQGANTYLVYTLAAAMQPAMMMVVDDKLEPVPVLVHVGTAVDVVGRVGSPRGIAGIHTHTSPVLLTVGERAELASSAYESVSPVLDGVCIVRKITEISDEDD